MVVLQGPIVSQYCADTRPIYSLQTLGSQRRPAWPGLRRLWDHLTTAHNEANRPSVLFYKAQPSVFDDMWCAACGSTGTGTIFTPVTSLTSQCQDDQLPPAVSEQTYSS